MSGTLLGEGALANGNPAITFENDIFVRQDKWRAISNPSVTFFEEIVHTFQFAQAGTALFAINYGLGIIGSVLQGENGHTGNFVETNAFGIAQTLFGRYNIFVAKGICSE